MLVFLCFLLIFAVVLRFKLAKNFSESVLLSTVVFSVTVVSITELLSIFKSINLISVYFVWGILCVGLTLLLFWRRNETYVRFSELKSIWKSSYQSLKWYEKTFLFTIVFFLLLLLIQGLIYPPNNWDSLTYHMTRIMYWIGNESVSHFPTHIFRNLYQPPFAEYLIMNVNLINGNDYLSNCIQWFFLIISVFSVYAAVGLFSLPRFYKLLAIFLMITIPAVELQSTNTKNDIVAGCFIIMATFYSVQSYRKNTLKNFLLLGASVGLALLTKGTSYLFLTPILLIYVICILSKVIRSKEISFILYGFAAVVMAILINIGHYSRNYNINGNIISIDEQESKGLSNEEMNGKFLFSNLMKNGGLHLGYPLSAKSDTIIRKIHKDLSINIDDPRLNYLGLRYEGARRLTTNEDYIPNTIHFFLMNAALAIIGFYGLRDFRKRKLFLCLASIILLQVLLFCAFLKWQPWHTRLHIPIFMISSIMIVAAAYLSKWFKYLIIGTTPIILGFFCFYYTYNNTRPMVKNTLFTQQIKPSDTRLKKYFSNQPWLYNEYSGVLDQLYSMEDYRKIGSFMSDWEYPVFHDFYTDKLQIIAINVDGQTSKITQDTKNLNAIISNSINQKFIEFEGKKYINRTPTHTHIWFYK